MSFKKFTYKIEDLKYDLPASIAVFLVAIPLCLGIAQASNAPYISGLISGILGGLVIGVMSGSHVSVSGPAAGLTAICISGIAALGSFEAFLVAVMIGGILQLLMGLFRAGFIANYFPSAVIKGMLAAIGLILIFKEFPHLVGFDVEDFAAESMNWSVFGEAFSHILLPAFTIGLVSLGILILWELFLKNRVPFIPGSLVAVLVGVVLNLIFQQMGNGLAEEHMVQIPEFSQKASFGAALKEIPSIDFAVFADPDVSLGNIIGFGITIALIASLETLLSVEAVDRMDPEGRQTPKSRELVAQGTANTISGLIGGLPITAVIVRSTTNLYSGARTKISTILHGIWLVIAVFMVASYINMIPLASLAAVLMMVGYKLASPQLFKSHFRKGIDQFIPFVVTIGVVLLVNLLVGVAVGLATAIFFTLRRHLMILHIKREFDGNIMRIKLSQELSFLHKANLKNLLESIPEGYAVEIDGTNTELLDFDILEALAEFRDRASERGITVHLKNIDLERLHESFPMRQLFRPSVNGAGQLEDGQQAAQTGSAAPRTEGNEEQRN
jgi:SulP family sulfate permease